MWEGINSATECSDGNYFIAASSTSTGFRKSFLLKLDSAGDTLFTKINEIDSVSLSTALESAFQLNDGSFLVPGTYTDYTIDSVSGENNAYLCKYDSVFNMVFLKQYGWAGSNEYCQKMIKDNDGGYILCGQTTKTDINTDIYLAKIDSVGNLLWQKGIYIWAWQRPMGIALASDGGFIISCNTGSALASDILIIKTDSVGNIKWQKIIGGPYDNGYWVKISTLADGNFLVSSSTGTFNGGYEPYIAKISATGNLIWEKTNPYQNNAYFMSNSIELPDKSILIAGNKDVYVPSFGTSYLHATVSKIDSSGTRSWERIYYAKEDASNYFYGLLSETTTIVYDINSLKEDYELIITTITGNIIKKIKLDKTGIYTFNENLQAGLYFCTINSNEKTIATQKMIVIK